MVMVRILSDFGAAPRSDEGNRFFVRGTKSRGSFPGFVWTHTLPLAANPALGHHGFCVRTYAKAARFM
jgi:hypothetical protein